MHEKITELNFPFLKYYSFFSISGWRTEPIMSVWFTRDGQGLLVSCLDSSVRLIDKDTGELLQEYSFL